MEKTTISTRGMDQAHHPPFAQLLSEEYTGQVMPGILKGVDLLALFFLAVFFVTNSATAAGGGVISYVYWAAGTIGLFLPSIIAADQLAKLFPHEGSIYVWTYKAFGPVWAFFAGSCWWLPGAVVVFNAASGCITFIQGLNTGWLVPPWQQGLAILGIIVLSHVAATRRTNMVRILVNLGALFSLIATMLIGLSGLVWLLSGHASATNFVHTADWQISPSNLSLFGLITISLLGVQAPLNMTGEIAGSPSERQRRIRGHLYWGALLVLVCYLVSTFTLLVIEGPENGASPFALVTAVNQVLGNLGGSIVVISIMASLIVTAIMYQVLFSRLLFVAAVDKRLPRSFGQLSPNRVPTKAIRLQTIVAIFFDALVYIIIPYFIASSSPANLSNEAFNIGAAVVTFVWGVASLFPFASLFKFFLFSRERHIFQQQRILPVPVLCFISALGLIGCLVTIADVFFNSWLPGLISNTIWQIFMGAFLSILLALAFIGGLFASSEVDFQQLNDDYNMRT